MLLMIPLTSLSTSTIGLLGCNIMPDAARASLRLLLGLASRGLLAADADGDA
jgi:hypothetical protein